MSETPDTGRDDREEAIAAALAEGAAATGCPWLRIEHPGATELRPADMDAVAGPTVPRTLLLRDSRGDDAA